jgi:hypothetical protein
MVLVAPPKGWISPDAAPSVLDDPAVKQSAFPPPVPEVPIETAATPPSVPIPPPLPIPANSQVSSVAATFDGAFPAVKVQKPGVAIPPSPKTTLPPIRSTLPPKPPPLSVNADEMPPMPPPIARVGWLWYEWLMLIGAPLLGVVVVVGAWLIFYSPRVSRLPLADSMENQPAELAIADRESFPDAQPEPLPTRIDRRWLPDRTALLLSFQTPHLTMEPNLNNLIDQSDQAWEKTCAALLESLNLKAQQIRRMTLAATDLAAWPKQSVAILELQKGQNTDALAAVSDPAGFRLNDAECRRLRNAAWPHPLVAVDRQTIVTGDEVLLRQLAARGEPRLESAPLDRLLTAMSPDADAMLLLDLAAARKAKSQLPANLLDLWSAGKQSWHLLWELPEAMGCTLRYSDRIGAELALVCDSESASDRARLALTQLIPASKSALGAQIESIPEKLKAGLFTARVAEQYELLMKQASAALQNTRCDISQGIVWAKIDWSEAPAVLAALATDSREAIRADWLSAIDQADRGNYNRLLGGLVGYRKAEGQFPVGASGGVLLPPDTRLSWIAAMLPYLGHADWHRKLQPGDSWNGPQNKPVTRLMLPEVINPAFGPDQTPAGFGVTHYVGVAGVGADAGSLKADDPRAGVFGFSRSARPEDMPRGASNTLALLGVTKRVGPWGQGGDSTVRALTQAPYVNGPDGFGSGQPDGMLAGMADGSIHFISKDVDPRVLEQLAMLHGNEDISVASLVPKPAPPKPKAAEAKPAAPDSGEKPGAPGLDMDIVRKGAGQPPAAKSPALRVDVAARLAGSIPAIDLKEMPFVEAVNMLASLCSVPIAFDPDALSDLQVPLGDPVTVKLSDTTAAQLLESLLSARGLVSIIDNGQLLITCPSDHREKLANKRYTVSDLAENAAAMNELASLVQKLVVPESWQVNGGRGTIRPEGSALAVSQSEAVHCGVVIFCEKLRIARGLPLKSRLDPDLFILITRQDRAKDWLDAPITVNFSEPTPLPEILAYLEKEIEANILVDRLAIGAVSQSPDVKTTWKVEKKRLAAALGDLLQPLGLSYRVVDGETLQVSAKTALDARLELEFYPLPEKAIKGQSAGALLDRIRNNVAPATWNDAGGSGALYLDKTSGCLIVLQSQPVQAAVRQLVSSL